MSANKNPPADAGHQPLPIDSGARPTVAVDCTQAAGFCIAVTGVRGGKAFTCQATDNTSGDVVRVDVGTPRWGVSCAVPADEIAVNVEFPVQPAGPVSQTAGPTNAAFQVSVDPWDLAQGSTLGSMTETSNNLVSAKLSGSIDANGAGLGTVVASWGAPGAACESGEPGNPCVDGSFTMTFHVPLP